MPQPYFNDVVMTTSYAPIVPATNLGNTGTVTAPGDVVGSLGTAGLMFWGDIRAKVGNTDDILIQSAAYSSVNGTLSANDPPIFLDGVDLSQISVKSAHAGDILKVAGRVDQLY